MTKWVEIKETIDALYPTFQEYVKKKGHLMVVDIAWIKVWYEFLEFMEKKNG